MINPTQRERSGEGYTLGVETPSLPVDLSLGRLRSWLKEDMAVWGLRSMADEIEVRINTRMTRSLGNARPVEKRVTLAAWLMTRPEELICEVLCHEAAHIAVFTLHGRGCRPHGKEWKDLMVRAGFEPRVRIDVPDAPRPRRRRRRRASGLHRIAGAMLTWIRA